MFFIFIPITPEKICFSSDPSDHYTNQRVPLDIVGFVQDCSNSITNALESLQSCAKPSTWCTGSVWSYCQGGQLPWSIESHMRGQSNHSNQSVSRATIQVQHYFNHITVKQQYWHKNWFNGGFCETGCSQLDVTLHVRGPHVFTVTLY